MPSSNILSDVQLDQPSNVPSGDGSGGRGGSTPYTDRGVTEDQLSFGDVKFSLDWWRFTIWCSRESIMPLLALFGFAHHDQDEDGNFKYDHNGNPIYEVALKDAGSGGLGFRRREDGLNGFQLYSSPINEPLDGQTYCSINIPAKALHNIGFRTIDLAYTWLCEEEKSGLRWNTTRCDLACDTQGFGVSEVVAAYHAGLVKTPARDWEEKTNSKNGHTFYIGSRDSERLLRVYRKTDGFSFGDEAFTRVELELKDKRAALSMRLLMDVALLERPKLAAGLILDYVNIEADWWAQMMAGIEAAWVIIRRRVPTIKTALAWIDKQVAPTLAVVALALTGGDVAQTEALVGRLLEAGRKRLKKHHRDMAYGYVADSAPQFAVAGL